MHQVRIDTCKQAPVAWRTFLKKEAESNATMTLPAGVINLVDDAIAKADTLIEAMGWIRRFRGKTTVIKLGGSLLEDTDAIRHLLVDVIFMETVGMRPVIVHGGGPSI